VDGGALVIALVLLHVGTHGGIGDFSMLAIFVILGVLGFLAVRSRRG